MKIVSLLSLSLLLISGCSSDQQDTSGDVSVFQKDALIVPLKRRKAIWDAMGKDQYPEKRPLLTLEQFFLHSNNEADLWYNIAPYPEDIDQYEFHRLIRSRSDVWDVLISITQLDSVPALRIEEFAEDGWFEWPNSDHTLIVTSADEKTIRSWFPKDVQPDEINIGAPRGNWATPDFIPEGFHMAWLWYD